MVNSHLVCDPTIRQPGFDLPQQQWSLLNRFCTEQGHCSACRRKWRLTDTDLCPCGETQLMSHIVESCPLTKLNGGYLGYTLRMKTLFCGWPVMVHDTHTRRRSRSTRTGDRLWSPIQALTGPSVEQLCHWTSASTSVQVKMKPAKMNQSKNFSTSNYSVKHVQPVSTYLWKICCASSQAHRSPTLTLSIQTQQSQVHTG